MTIEVVGTHVEVLGKSYQLKCPPDEVVAVQKAAAYLDEKMQAMRQLGHVLSVDRIAVLAALALSHERLKLEQEKLAYEQEMNERLHNLQKKLDAALAQNAQMELPSAN